MRRFAFGILAAIALAATASGAEESLDAATLRQRVLAASGSPQSAYREIITYSSGSEHGTRVYLRRGAEWRERDDGVFKTERGFSKGESWYQNANGLTIFGSAGSPSAAGALPPSPTVTRVHEPLEAWVASGHDVAGNVYRSYVDPQSYHIIRTEQVLATGTITTTYDDFRTGAGGTRPYHWLVDNKASRTSSEMRLESYEAVAPTDAELKPPPVRRLVFFPEGAHEVELPSTFGPYVLVRVTVNGRGLDFVLDTGASGIVIDSQLASELGLERHSERSNVIAARVSEAMSIIPEMTIGTLQMHNVAVHVAPVSANLGTGAKVVGLLGFDFFATLGVTIDYERKRVTVTPADDFVAPAVAGTIDLPIRVGGESPVVTARVNDVVGNDFVLDTGAPTTLLLFSHFLSSHPDALVAASGFRPLGSDERNGVGGTFETKQYRPAALQIGGLLIKETAVRGVASSGAYPGSYDGLIGSQILSYFNLTFDYTGGHVYLLPRSARR